MKTLRITFSVAIMLITGIMVMYTFTGCEKLPDPPPPLPQAYMNMNDDSTTAIKASIPRIELSKLKSTKITIYLSVTDQKGNPFKDFNQYNFLIKQVCVGATDTTFVASLSFNKLNVEGKNIATPLILDYSGSMSYYISEMESAVANFINQKEEADQAELIKFSDFAENVQPFTESSSTLISKLAEYWPGSGNSTAFYDGIYIGLDDASSFISTNFDSFFPAVIGFTDGQDNNSANTMNSIISKSQLIQIPVYTLGFGEVSEYNLNTIAEQTGGRYYYAPDISQLSALYTLISGQLQNVYVVSWIYDNPDCSEVLIVVEAGYECLNGQFYSRVEKIFYPLGN